MTIQEYQELSNRPCANLGLEKLNLTHMALGWHSEYAEIKSAEKNMDMINYGEELTDQIWYLSNYCTFRNLNMQDIILNRYESILSLEEDLSNLSDIIKKYIAYNKEIDKQYELDLLKRIFYRLLDLYRCNDLDFHKCLENNINKLKVRFPEKFTEENALNRNLEQERKTLEK